jgi:2-oxoglutarate dehydrogenase E2 component (dihydrolipoamide succinyltransferase)
MAKPVVMPQMGESVAEGTIVRWLKKVGDAVERDEPLFEISTDKVDAEIPSPAAGVVSEVKVKEGETVPINTVVAVIDETASKPAAAAKPAEAPAKPTKVAAPVAPSAPNVPVSAPQGDGDTTAPSATADKPVAPSAPIAPAPPAPIARRATAPAPVAPTIAPTDASASAQSARADKTAGKPGLAKPWSAAEARELRLSPVVRKIAHEHHVDVRNIAGSGEGGRVTKSDILAYIDAGAPTSAADAAMVGKPVAPSAPVLAPNPAATAGLDASKYERMPMSVMRRKIAEHMVMSRRTSPHVHSAFEIDFTKVDEIRKAQKAEYEKAGGKLTYMSFITKACAEALKKVPIVNASVDGTDIIYKKEINIGVAVALDWGLIVPVVKNADQLNLLDISKAIADLAARARDKKLKPEDVQGGTFTITNPGVFGALFGMAIISQPQLAIVGVGAVEKRPVVLDDTITIRLRAYMTIGYDHRVIDGAIADEFMQVVKKTIENWDAVDA